MKKILIVLLILVSFNSNASFFGKWSGPSSYTDSDGYKNDFLMKVYFLPYNQNHIFYSNSFTGHHLDLEIRDGELFYGDMKMGSITENQFILSLYGEPCVGKMVATLDHLGNLDYVDKYNCNDGYNYLTQGYLIKAE